MVRGRLDTAHEVPHSMVSTMRLRADEARQRLEDRRPTSTVVDTVFRALQLDRESGGTLLAGAIAFRFFLFLIPCAFLVVTGLGIGSDLAGADPRDVARHAGITGIAATAIQSGAQADGVTRWVTFALATVAVILGSRNLVQVLRVCHARMWKVPYSRPRHGAVAVIAVLGISAVIVSLIRLVAALRGITFIGWIVGLVAFAAVPAGIWMFVSARLFPVRPGVTWRHVLPGAMLFGVGVEALHLVTVLWVARSIETKSETYGTIGVALTLLAWAYLLGRLVIAAAAVNAAVWATDARSEPPGMA